MTTSLVLTVNTTRADLNKYVKSSTSPRVECTELSQLFKSLASGTISGSVVAQKSSAAAAKATGTITLDYSNLTNSDTVTIAGQTITLVTGSPSGFTQSKIETPSTKCATNLAAAINGNTAINTFVSATSALGVVTITCLTPGVIGNAITLAKNTSTGAGGAVSAAALAGGTGGYATAGVTYSRGL